MISKQAKRQYWLIRTVVKPLGHAVVPLWIKRRLSLLWQMALKSTKHVNTQKDTLNGIPYEWYRSPASQGREDKVMLYLHGGAYVLGSAAGHRAFVQRFHQIARLDTVSLDYRLAPEHPYPAAVDDAEKAWHALLALGYQPQHIVVAGDSAGGGLALALVQRLKRCGHAMPAAVFAICPWIDLQCQNESYRLVAGRDAMLHPETLRRAAAQYADGNDTTHPEISPLYGDWQDAPPILVHAATEDMLIGESREFAKRNPQVSFKAWSGMWHVFHAHVADVPEAQQAAQEGFAFLNWHLQRRPATPQQLKAKWQSAESAE